MFDVLSFEAKRLFTRRNIIIFSCILILLLIVSLGGISDYKMILENKKPFKEMEKDKVSLHIHYTFYGIRGVRLLLIPSAMSVLFNNTSVFPGMTAHVDTAEKLNISNSIKGKDLFSNAGDYMDFSGLMLLIGSFLSLLYGYDSTRNREYISLLQDISKKQNIVFKVILSRIILLCSVFVALSILFVVWLMVIGIQIFNLYYLIFLVFILGIITFFVLSGAGIGRIRSKTIRGISLPVFYFMMVLFIPWVIREIVYLDARSNIQSIYNFEYETFKYVMEFEKEQYERFGVWKSGEVAPEEIKKMIETIDDRIYNKLKELENKRIDQITKRIKVYSIISSLFPTTFYISNNRELSSKGFRNFLDFYRYAYNKKFLFIKFYLERKFFRPLPKTGVEPFIKGDEDLFYAEPRLQYFFGGGVSINAIFILVIAAFLYMSVHKKIDRPQLTLPEIDVTTDKSNFVLCEDDSIRNEYFDYFRSKEGYVCIDFYNLDFKSNDVSLKHFINFFCKISGCSVDDTLSYLDKLSVNDLELREIGRDLILKIHFAVKLASCPDPDFVIINDCFGSKGRDFESSFTELLTTLEVEGGRIIYLSSRFYFPRESLNETELQIDKYATFSIPWKDVTLT